jgi:hypothetical protein
MSWQCFGSESGFNKDTDADPDSESGSGSRRATKTHKNGKKLDISCFASAGCSLFYSCKLFSTFSHQNPRSGPVMDTDRY